jgi:hypothetical protein
MKLAYENLMKELKLTLDSDVLDPAFVEKAKDFQEKLSNKELTAEQIEQTDAELVEMLNAITEEDDSDEVKAEKRRAEIAEARNVIAEADTIEKLTGLEAEYMKKGFKELLPFIDKRKEKIEKAARETAAAEEHRLAMEEITGAKYEDLAALSDKYKGNADLEKAINDRIEKEKPAPKDKTLREKILAKEKRKWFYQDLREIGINPTGEQEMEIEGITFTREVFFKVYYITAVDGKKV